MKKLTCRNQASSTWKRPLALPAILLGIIYSGIASPTEAAAVAAGYALLLAFGVYRSMSFAGLMRVIADAVTTTATIGLILAGAFVFNYAIANEGVPHAQLIDAALALAHRIAEKSPLAVAACLAVTSCTPGGTRESSQ